MSTKGKFGVTAGTNYNYFAEELAKEFPGKYGHEKLPQIPDKPGAEKLLRKELYRPGEEKEFKTGPLRAFPKKGPYAKPATAKPKKPKGVARNKPPIEKREPTNDDGAGRALLGIGIILGLVIVGGVIKEICPECMKGTRIEGNFDF